MTILQKWFPTFFSYMGVNQPSGSAFSKIAVMDDSLLQARGKLSALKDSVQIKKNTISSLNVDTAYVHADLQEQEARLAKLHELL
jgi:hypothetical protein